MPKCTYLDCQRPATHLMLDCPEGSPVCDEHKKLKYNEGRFRLVKLFPGWRSNGLVENQMKAQRKRDRVTVNRRLEALNALADIRDYIRAIKVFSINSGHPLHIVEKFNIVATYLGADPDWCKHLGEESHE